MEYLLLLSTKVKGETGSAAVEQLRITTEEIGRKIPEDRHKIIAFFLADETKGKIQALASQLGTAVQIFQVALQLNTDEKVEEVRHELRALKLGNEASSTGGILQELKNLQLNAKGKLNFSVFSVEKVNRGILNSKMRQYNACSRDSGLMKSIGSPQGFNSVVIGHGGITESLQDSVIETDGDIDFTTIAGSPADFAAWSDVLRR
ncbi:hypothetical protein FB45DRAFT_915012 [Roridomyces roridus]|uniref:Uncharacterized protein n=1 Tax=Roridomyces roridus TaxID=1738132 RepID=A0AAD7BU73_9AGAR|nr:hypothetical protein FB45DRAFT_915012 [Roridomyces roridus]